MLQCSLTLRGGLSIAEECRGLESIILLLPSGYAVELPTDFVISFLFSVLLFQKPSLTSQPCWSLWPEQRSRAEPGIHCFCSSWRHWTSSNSLVTGIGCCQVSKQLMPKFKKNTCLVKCPVGAHTGRSYRVTARWVSFCFPGSQVTTSRGESIWECMRWRKASFHALHPNNWLRSRLRLFFIWRALWVHSLPRPPQVTHCNHSTSPLQPFQAHRGLILSCDMTSREASGQQKCVSSTITHSKVIGQYFLSAFILSKILLGTDLKTGL